MDQREAAIRSWADPEIRERRMEALKKSNSRPRSREHRKRLGAAHVGLVASKLTRRKMVISHKRRLRLAKKNPNLCRMCGSSFHSTTRHKRKLTAARLRSKVWKKAVVAWNKKPKLFMQGEKHWRWKGGATCSYSTNFKRLRVLVLARDSYKCFQCKATKNLVVHHIDHNSLHDFLDNLITLCVGDNNRAEHKKYKSTWQKKFLKYTKKIVYTGEL